MKFKPLTPKERELLRGVVEYDLVEWLKAEFDRDNLEKRARQGWPQFKGIDDMTDEELINEYGHFDPEFDKTFEQRVEAWRKERRE